MPQLFIMCFSYFSFLFFVFFLASSSEQFISSISNGGGVRWEGYSPPVSQRDASPRRWSMLADSDTMPGDPAGNGTSNREPFIIGVAGGTASGKVGILIAALHVDRHCLIGVWVCLCVCEPKQLDWSLFLGGQCMDEMRWDEGRRIFWSH